VSRVGAEKRRAAAAMVRGSWAAICHQEAPAMSSKCGSLWLPTRCEEPVVFGAGEDAVTRPFWCVWRDSRS
jgi:hypothetical protein